jgi:glycosyltransferase involved in cell wall biosynthesis
MRVTHLIADLDLGGAESSLCGLVEATREYELRHTIVSMLSGGALRDRLQRAGATVIELRGERGIRGALLFRSVNRAIRDSHPDILQCWMYHSNIAASVLAISGSLKCPIVWGIRQGAENISVERLTTRGLILAGVPLSHHPARIVYNSEVSAKDHERLGYARSARVVIRNGIDCHRFRPLADVAERLRSELGLASDAILIGRVARYAPMKDHLTLLRSFSSIIGQLPAAHLVLVGPSLSGDTAQILGLAQELGCSDHIHVLRPRMDIQNFYPALDILVSSSKFNEGFPNSVAEALACGTLVVSTEVGDTTLVHNGCHRTVSRGDAEQLTAAILEITQLSPEIRKELGAKGRSFMLNNFDQATFASAFTRLWHDVRRQ